MIYEKQNKILAKSYLKTKQFKNLKKNYYTKL